MHMTVQYVHQSFFSTIVTQQKETGIYPFLQKDTLTINFIKISIRVRIGKHIEDELGNEDSHDQTTQRIKQETKESNLLVERQNIFKSLKKECPRAYMLLVTVSAGKKSSFNDS